MLVEQSVMENHHQVSSTRPVVAACSVKKDWLQHDGEARLSAPFKEYDLDAASFAWHGHVCACAASPDPNMLLLYS